MIEIKGKVNTAIGYATVVILLNLGKWTLISKKLMLRLIIFPAEEMFGRDVWSALT